MVIPDSIITFLKPELLGTLFSAIAYGIVIVLSGNCFHLLQRKRSIYSNRMRIILLIYVPAMLLLSTWALIHSIYNLMSNITLRWADPRFLPFELPFVIWGADWFLVSILILRWEPRFLMQLQIWRCVVLYHDLSKGPRTAIIALLSLLSFASLGRSISFYSPGSHSKCS